MHAVLPDCLASFYLIRLIFSPSLSLSLTSFSHILNEFSLFDIQIPCKVLYLSVCSTNLYVLCIIQKYISPGDTGYRVRVKSSRSCPCFMEHILCFHDQINAMKFINLSTWWASKTTISAFAYKLLLVFRFFEYFPFSVFCFLFPVLSFFLTANRVVAICFWKQNCDLPAFLIDAICAKAIWQFRMPRGRSSAAAAAAGGESTLTPMVTIMSTLCPQTKHKKSRIRTSIRSERSYNVG